MYKGQSFVQSQIPLFERILHEQEHQGVFTASPLSLAWAAVPEQTFAPQPLLTGEQTTSSAPHVSGSVLQSNLRLEVYLSFFFGCALEGIFAPQLTNRCFIIFSFW